MNYQQLAARTRKERKAADLSDFDTNFLYAALGLATESAELLEKVKKIIFHGHAWNRQEILSEVGDVQWYVAELCTVLDEDLEHVQARNINKLRARYPDGYSDADSRARVDVEG